MTVNLRQMSVDNYAAMHRDFGAAVIKRQGVYWRRTRPFFYRPLLPMEVVDIAKNQRPFLWPVASQHVVPEGQASNSAMGFVVLDSLSEYSLASVGHRRRHLISQSCRRFSVRPILDPVEIKQQGHAVYLSFLQRTGYSYKDERRQKGAFDAWVDALFARQGVLVLGGFGPEGLVAVSSSYWVGQTLIYATLFCESQALRQNLGEAMFHALRQIVAQEPGISRIHVRNYQGGSSLDKYYLLRGAKLVYLPTRLVAPSGARWCLQRFFPKVHAALVGPSGSSQRTDGLTG